MIQLTRYEAACFPECHLIVVVTIIIIIIIIIIIVIINIIVLIIITVIITRPYAALRAAGLDWIFTLCYNLGWVF